MRRTSLRYRTRYPKILVCSCVGRRCAFHIVGAVWNETKNYRLNLVESNHRDGPSVKVKTDTQ